MSDTKPKVDQLLNLARQVSLDTCEVCDADVAELHAYRLDRHHGKTFVHVVYLCGAKLNGKTGDIAAPCPKAQLALRALRRQADE